MALDPRKRQKQLERRKKKAKARKQALAVRQPQSWSGRMTQAGAAPVLHCFTTQELWDQGISDVLFSRQLSNGSVAFVAFLVDVYCLGVKDVAFNFMPRSAYDERVYGHFRNCGSAMVKLQPECARKLIEGAVAYARDFGLPPHSDYSKCAPIFGDVDPAECDREFTYGKDGKPYFIAGPHDRPERCRRILSLLRDRFGDDGFHFLVPLHSSDITSAHGEILALEDDVLYLDGEDPGERNEW